MKNPPKESGVCCARLINSNKIFWGLHFSGKILYIFFSSKTFSPHIPKVSRIYIYEMVFYERLGHHEKLHSSIYSVDFFLSPPSFKFLFPFEKKGNRKIIRKSRRTCVFFTHIYVYK